jgi:hypothetical protein
MLGGTRLPGEAVQAVGILAELGGQQLDGDLAVEFGVAGEKDLTHATGADFSDDAVMRKG